MNFSGAMIIPEGLRPLPVMTPEESGSVTELAADAFVTDSAVRRVVLGAMVGLPVEGLPAEDFDCFAGRSDIPYPGRTFLTEPAPVAPSASVEPGFVREDRPVHPAFESIVSSSRRAAPPQAYPAADLEAGYGSPRRTERWWVIAMGLAVGGILCSGTVVDFISREAVRRSRAGAPLDILHVIPAERAPQPELAPAAGPVAALPGEHP